MTDQNKFSKPIRNIEIDPTINNSRSPNNSLSPSKRKVGNFFPKDIEKSVLGSSKKIFAQGKDTIE